MHIKTLLHVDMYRDWNIKLNLFSVTVSKKAGLVLHVAGSEKFTFIVFNKLFPFRNVYSSLENRAHNNLQNASYGEYLYSYSIVEFSSNQYFKFKTI